MQTLQESDVGLSPKLQFVVQDTTFYGDESFFLHDHDYYEFMLVVSGKLIHQLNGRREVISSRSLCFLNPGDVHSLHNSPESSSVHIINIAFSRKLFQSVAIFLFEDISFDLKDSVNYIRNLPENEWNGLLWKINELLNPSGFNADESKRRKAFFKSLLQDVLAILLKHNRHDPEATPEWLKFSVEEMRKQENFRVGLRKFLELAGKSQEHLTRSMQLYYNTSPQKYITGLRISEAARLLRNTRMDISKIMYETGFNNTSYFRRCFKQKYGMPPVKYLKKSQQFF